MEHRRRNLLNSLEDDIPSSPDLPESDTINNNAIYYHNQYEYKGTLHELWVLFISIIKLIYWKCYQYMM